MDISTNLNILIVEDSDFMQKLFVKYLYEKGFYNITLAEDGNIALEKLEKNKIDLIISDWNMPNKDGLELLKEIRKNEKYKDTLFIMATAQGEKKKQIEAINEGANSHIAKPFNSDQLLESIEKAFGFKKEDKIIIKERKITNGKVQINIGHIQITDHLILGVLKSQIEKGEVNPKYFDLATHSMPGWNPIQESLEKNEIDGAFVLAPIAMDLFAYDVPIKLVMLAHKNGSIFVRSKVFKPDANDDYKPIFMNKIVNIPHKLSVHNMLAHQYLSKMGLKPGVPGADNEIDVTFEVIPPVLMPRTLMMTQNVAGFIVAEPIGSNAINKGIAELQFISSAIWNNHPCCVLAMREEFINEYKDAVYELVSLLVKAGKKIASNKEECAEIAVNFLDPERKLGLSVPVLKNVLEDPKGITTNDLYPVINDLDKMQRYMHDKMSIGQIIDLEKFIDFSFITEAVK